MMLASLCIKATRISPKGDKEIVLILRLIHRTFVLNSLTIKHQELPQNWQLSSYGRGCACQVPDLTGVSSEEWVRWGT